MSGWTQQMVDAHNRRLSGEPPERMAPPDAPEREIEQIHYPILRWCAEHYTPCIRARSDQPSGITRGATDFVIGYRGHTLWIECKANGGKLGPEQLAFRLLCDRQGLEYHVVYSFAEFLNIIEGLP